jgi:outer membrane protein assembly factor BamA
LRCGFRPVGPAALAALVLFAGAAHAQDEEAPSAPPPTETSRPHDFSFLAMPIPISDPAIGNGLAIGAGLLYKAGGSDRPWITGGGVLYTDNESWAAAVVQKAYIGADRFRVAAAGGIGEFNVDYYGIGPAAGDRGVSIPITQEAGFVGAQAMMRVVPNLYAGLQYRFIDMTTTVRFDPPPFPDLEIPPLELNTVSSALGLTGEYDTRDNEYQPGQGLYVTATWLFADSALGSDIDYSRGEFRANGYDRLSEKAIVAWRASVCQASDSAPFYDICNFGSQSDLRGYVMGQYRDRSMFAIQTEYRRKLFGRFGMVVFAGVGAVAPDFGAMTGEELLPAGGVGLRFEASRKYGVNVGVDYAVGRDSSAFYFRIGEAF